MRNKSIFILGIICAILLVGCAYFCINRYAKIEEFQSGEWLYLLNKKEKTASIENYNGLEENLNISEVVFKDDIEYKIIRIENCAFQENKNIRSIVIPNTVIEIKDSAFYGCENLNKVVLPDSVKKIGESTFDNCNKLRSISMNENGEEKSYNENYIHYLKLSDREKAEVEVIPRKEFVPLSSLKKGTETKNSKVLLEKYNLKDDINIIVENQGQAGWCWAYSSLKAVDTYAAINLGVNYNSSEAHLAYTRSTFFGGWVKSYKNSTDVWNDGGYFDMLNMYARDYAKGPVLESEIPNKKYEFSAINKEKFENANKFLSVMNTIDYPSITKEYKNDGSVECKNGSDICSTEEINEFRNSIKEHIVNNGGLYTFIQSPDDETEYYNPETASYYWNGDESKLLRDIGHAVTIVGWDDTYSRDNFNSNSKPTNDGAYICLNSWGSNWGKNGYFYISYDDYTVESELSGVVDVEKLPENIEITKMPTKIDYIQNFESIDLTGGEFKVTFKDGTIKSVSMLDERVSISGFDNKTLGEKIITLKYTLKKDYDEFETSFKVNIKEATLTGIKIEKQPNKLNYVKSYESLDLTGMSIKKIYNNTETWNETISNIDSSEFAISGFDNTTLGEKNIVIKYMDKIASFNVNVVNVISLNVCNLPRKTLYDRNDKALILDEGKIEVLYSNNQKWTIDMTDVNFSSSGFDTSSVGKKTITLTYCGNYSTNFTIEVLENLFEYTIDGEEAKITGYIGNDKALVIPATIEKDGKTYNVTSLDDSAFSSFNQFVSADIPKYMNNIANAFLECNNLEKITVNEENTTYMSLDGILYNKTGEMLYLYPTGKKENSFTIPSSVLNIGPYAFYKCFNLKEIKLPETLNTIGSNAFAYCKNLINVEIPQGIKVIEDNVWARCTGILRVKISSTVEQISSTAFDGCIGLKEISVDENNIHYKSEDGILFNKEKTIIYLYPATKDNFKYVLPSSINEIAKGTFKNCSDLTYIDINNVSKIGEGAFWGCTGLKSIEIPNGVSEIGINTFRNCANLSEIEIPNTVKSIGQNGDNVFTGCRNVNVYTYSDATTVLEYINNHGNLNLKIITNPLESIKIKRNPDKVVYKDGQSFDSDGMEVVAVYKDKTETQVENYIVLNGNVLKEGQNNVAISYTENARSREVNQNVSVSAGDVKRIEIIKEPSKKEYKYGENFNSNGMVVEAIYENGSRKKITNYSILGGEKLSVDKGSITLSYTENGITVIAYQIINVSKANSVINNIQDLSKVYNGRNVSNPAYSKVGEGRVTVEWYKISEKEETKLSAYPKNAGKYKVKLIMAETDNYKGTSAEKEFEISKAIYDMSSVKFENVSYSYSGEEKQIVISGTLPQGVDVKYENNKGINAGEYTAIAIFEGDFENYNRISNMIAKLTITKINPEYNIPNGLIAIYGQTLGDVSLPDGFSWERELTTSVGEIGENRFTVRYTPTDVINYNIITGIEVVIHVKSNANAEILIDDYEVNEEKSIVSKILPGVSVEEFKSHIRNTNYKIINGKGEELKEEDRIGTGYKIELESGKQYTLVVYGDLNGDGKVNVIDIARLQKVLTRISEETELIKISADLKEDSKLDLNDLARLQKLATGQNIFK